MSADAIRDPTARAGGVGLWDVMMDRANARRRDRSAQDGRSMQGGSVKKQRIEPPDPKPYWKLPAP
jgi:hypothetical protein